MGKRRKSRNRKKANVEQLQSIQMLPREWLKILYTRNNWLEEAEA